MINEKQDIAFILSFLPTVDFIKERGKDCDVLSVTNNFEVAGQSLAKLEVTQHNLHLLLPSKVSRMAVMLVEDEDISMVDAMSDCILQKFIHDWRTNLQRHGITVL